MIGRSCTRAVAFAIVACVGRAPLAGAASFVVNSTLDAVDANPGDGVCATAAAVCTLRAAIQEANALAGADDITLPAGTLTLAIAGRDEDQAVTGDLDIHGPVTISGQGASATIVDGARIDRVFDVWGDAGAVTIQELTVRNGFADVAHVAGGIFNSTTLTLSQMRVESSEGPLGGGGIVNDGDLTATDVALVGNVTGSLGGGFWNSAGTARLERVTVSGNTSAAAAAGIQNDGDLTLVNVTVSGNTAVTDGGGLDNGNAATLENVTIAANTANRGGGIFAPGDTTFTNTIVATDTGGACVSFGIVTTLGSNLDDDASCMFTAAGDLSGVPAALGPLADNGGPTQTHLPLPGSPAIDAGTSCPPPATDQRGMPRPLDGNGDGSAVCDIGAVEVAFEPPATTTTTSTTLPSHDTPLAGTAIVLTDNAANPAKRKLVVVSKDKAVGVGAETPESVGATLRIVTVAGDGFDATYALPATGWRRQGRAGKVRGHQYRDPKLANGPIAGVVVKSGKLLKAIGRGAALGQSLAADPNPVWVVLTIGDGRQCMSFGGSKPKFSAGKRFTSHGAPRPAGCNPPAG